MVPRRPRAGQRRSVADVAKRDGQTQHRPKSQAASLSSLPITRCTPCVVDATVRYPHARDAILAVRTVRDLRLQCLCGLRRNATTQTKSDAGEARPGARARGHRRAAAAAAGRTSCSVRTPAYGHQRMDTSVWTQRKDTRSAIIWPRGSGHERSQHGRGRAHTITAPTCRAFGHAVRRYGPADTAGGAVEEKASTQCRLRSGRMADGAQYRPAWQLAVTCMDTIENIYS